MTGIGSSDLKHYWAGKHLSPINAIHAKCADCLANYADGRVSCELPLCPLYPYMPYNTNTPSKSVENPNGKLRMLKRCKNLDIKSEE
jgi:hypothetical protein